MAQQAIQPRDVEILRTLVRLRYLTSREIVAAFFTSNDVGTRRVRALSKMDLIRPHTNGVPTRFQYSAWRVTAEGLALVQKEFPQEPVPDGLLERLTEGSLTNVHHREALSRVYLEFLTRTSEQAPAEPDVAAVRARVTAIRARASSVLWEPDGAVILRQELLGGKVQQIVPDATMTSLAEPVRVFLELDRSTKTLPRIEECFERYKRFARGSYDATYPDTKAPWVVFVVPSRARRASVAEVARRVLDDAIAWRVKVSGETTPLLERLLLGTTEAEEAAAPEAQALPEPGAASTPPTSPPLAKRLYRWGRQLYAHLNQHGLAAQLPGEFLAEGEQHLLALYEEIQKAKANHAG